MRLFGEMSIPDKKIYKKQNIVERFFIHSNRGVCSLSRINKSFCFYYLFPIIKFDAIKSKKKLC